MISQTVNDMMSDSTRSSSFDKKLKEKVQITFVLLIFPDIIYSPSSESRHLMHISELVMISDLWLIARTSASRENSQFLS